MRSRLGAMQRELGRADRLHREEDEHAGARDVKEPAAPDALDREGSDHGPEQVPHCQDTASIGHMRKLRCDRK